MDSEHHIKIELHKRHCIGCFRPFMVKREPAHPFCSRLCLLHGNIQFKDRPYAATSKVVDIKIRPSRNLTMSQKRKVSMRKAFRPLDNYTPAAEVDDE